MRPYNDTTWYQKSDEPVRNLKCHKMERIERPNGLCFDSNNLSEIGRNGENILNFI